MKKWNGIRSVNNNSIDSYVPLYLWGIGNVAQEVYIRLLEEGIKIEGVFETAYREPTVKVSDEKRMWNGYEVQNWDTLEKKVTMMDVILGHAQYHKGIELEKYENVRYVYYVYSPFRTHQTIDISYYNKYYNEYCKSYNLFEEDYSKCLFQAYLDSKMNEDIVPILKVFRNPITFFENDIISLGTNECYVDIGAYDGDTIKQFINKVQDKYYKIFAFEPDRVYYEKLVNFIEDEALRDIYPSRVGIWNSDGYLYFETDGQQSGKIASEGDTIKVSKLDTSLQGEPVSLIKINMSGSIIECLEGARDIIKINRPKIIVNVSLVRDALWRVPLLLKAINSDYKFYLRFNESMASRLTLYVI